MDEENRQDEALARKLEMTAKLLSLAYGLISIAWLIWILIPEHQRRLMAMKAARTLETSAWSTASRAGRQAMALELSGQGTNYELPYRLSVLAAKAGRAYERLRYSS